METSNEAREIHPLERIPSPRELFIAYEQPLEADPVAVAYLDAFPEYREYIRRVNEMQRLRGCAPIEGD